MKMKSGTQRLGLLALMLALTGCSTSHVMYREVQSQRASSYQRWKVEQDEQTRQLPQLAGQLALQDAIKISLLYNRTLDVVLQQRSVARGRITESYSAVLPSVIAGADYTRVDQTRAIRTADGEISMGQLDTYSLDLTLRQPLYRGGAIGAALRAARLYGLQADEQVRAAMQETIARTSIAYYDAVLARHLFEVNRDAVESAESHLNDVKVKFSNGVASRYDVLRAEVDVSNFRATMIQQQNQLHISEMNLLKAMGVAPSADIDLADDLLYVPSRADAERVLQQAYANRPDLYLAEISLRLQHESLVSTRSEYLPKMDAFFTGTLAQPDPHVVNLNEWGDQWVAGMAVTWPLFDGLGREGRMIQQKALVRQREMELKATEERAFTEVSQAVLSLADAEELVESQRMNLQRAGEGLRLAEVGYREGVNTPVEVVDARAALTRTRGLYYQALYSHNIARLEVLRAAGLLGPAAGASVGHPGGFDVESNASQKVFEESGVTEVSK